MAVDDVLGYEERRGLERRLEMAEHELRELDKRTAVMMTKIEALISTMDSRDKAFSRGQDLVLKGIDQLEKAQAKLEGDLKLPQDLSKLVFSPGVLIAVVMTIISIVGGQMASTWGMRSDIRDMRTSMTLQADVDKGAQRLQEERATTLKNAVDAIGRKQELQQIQFQELRDEVLGRPRTPR